jgi:hypothetical protein
MPKKGVLLFTIAAVSPRHHKTKNANGRDMNMMNGRETIFRAGDKTLGRKRNFSPYGT